MANKYINSEFLDKAILFAVKAHANSERRGKGFPYIIHPMEAMEIAATLTSDQELLAAAALHDVVEDTNVAIEDIRKEFGERVAALVDAESEAKITDVPEEESWHTRKRQAIERLGHASHDAKIVAIGDKLSNMRAIYRDYMQQGDKLWSLFHAPNGKPDHEWHYRGLAHALCDLAGTFAYKEFTWLIDEVFGTVKPELIDMDEYELSGDGFTALSYNHADGKTMIKLYADFMSPEVPLRELYTSWHIADMGLSIPKAHRYITDGKRFGVEFDRITPKVSFARAISNEPDKLELYASEFARECKTLHQTKCTIKEAHSVKERFHSVINKANILSEEEREKIHKFINEAPNDDKCCHGDLHIGNIITDGEKNYWIDLGDFAYGHAYFDLGMFYLACFANSEEMTQRLYHISNSQMADVWDVFISKYFGINTESEKQEINDIIRHYAALYMIEFSTRVEVFPEMENFIRKNI